jgi:hypothetical protein
MCDDRKSTEYKYEQNKNKILQNYGYPHITYSSETKGLTRSPIQKNETAEMECLMNVARYTLKV